MRTGLESLRTASFSDEQRIRVSSHSCQGGTTPGREDQIREGLMKTWKIMFAGLESAAS